MEYDDHLSTSQSLSTDGGRIDVAGGMVTVPDGSYEMGLEDDVRYRSRWEDFYTGIIPLVGACEVSFAHADERRFTWNLSNGVGIRTPF